MTSDRVVHCKRARYDVYIGRPSEWGNPFSHKPGTLAEHRVASRHEAIAKYREWLVAQPDLVRRVKQELRGKVLGCWCAPLPCHGDVLAEIANEPRHAYAGIGARATPPDVLALMTRIAYRLEREGYVLRSGGADGADSAFERGVQSPDNAEIYLPKPRFNGNVSPLHTFDAETERVAMTIAAAHHPKWWRCSAWVRKMHARNVHQILGRDLASPSKFVVCWTADGEASGGTGQALRVAAAYGVSIFNLHDPGAVRALACYAIAV